MAASDGREMSPASAAQGFYTPALRINPRASPSSKVAAASVALFREPRRRPAGLPDCPGWNGRLRPRAGGRGAISSLIELLRVVAYCVSIYTEYGIASIAIARAPRPLTTRARSADMGVWPVRRAIAFRVARGAERMVDDGGGLVSGRFRHVFGLPKPSGGVVTGRFEWRGHRLPRLPSRRRTRRSSSGVPALAFLAKLEPSQPRPSPLPPLTAGAAPRHRRRR